MLSFTEFRRIRKTYLTETRVECRLIWNKYIQMKKKMNSAPSYSGTKADLVIIDDIIPYKTNVSSMDMWYSSLGTTTVSPFAYGIKQEGNNPMNYATATVQAGTTETQDQRKYLSNRLDEIYYDHLRPLEAKFGLIDDDRPSTPKELKKRIADGMFIIKGLPVDGDEEEVEDGYFYGGWTNMIRWRDPAVKADHDGYAAATKELRDLRQKTLDIIKIDEPKAGLDAIKAFEAWTPTGVAN